MNKGKQNFSKLMVTLIILLNIAFSSSVLFVFIQTGAEPSALVVAWYAFTTGELWLLSKIKREKIKKEVK